MNNIFKMKSNKNINNKIDFIHICIIVQKFYENLMNALTRSYIFQ